MLNQVVVIGRIAENLALNKSEDGKDVLKLILAVPRNYKNINGQYETDTIPCVLWNHSAKSTAEYCHKGDLVGIKGTLRSKTVSTKRDKVMTLEIIVEKVTFLTTNKTEEES